MTQTFFLGQLRLMAVAIIAYGTGKGWFTPADSGLISGLLGPIGLLAGPWLWSIYSNVNSKLVPKDSVAIAADHVAAGYVATPGAMVKLVSNPDGLNKPEATASVKVVG